MKITKYQQGAVYTPIFRESVGQPHFEAATVSKSQAKEDNLIDQEIIKTLEEKGIPVDVDYF